MNSFVLLLALVATAFAKGGYYHPDATPSLFTREDCPPAGYTALSGHMRLDNLPYGGLYAICLTPTEVELIADAEGDNQRLVVNFTWNGVFKLTDSKLVVDAQIRIDARWPSRVEWNGVTVASMPSTSPGSQFQDGQWQGIVLNGAPEVPPTLGYGQKEPEYGNCGTLSKFSSTGVNLFNSSLTFKNCAASTKLNRISLNHIPDGAISAEDDDAPAVMIESSKGLIFVDLVVTSREDAVKISASEAAFIRPALFSQDGDGFDISEVSNITTCDPLIQTSDDSDDHDFEIADDDDSAPSTVAVAGRTNSFFPDDLSLGFGGGLLFTIKKCPSKMNPTEIPIKSWEHWWTGNGAEAI